VFATCGRAACAALAALVAFPLLLDAAPPQTTAAGVILPAGTIETIVLDQAASSATTQPGAVIQAHLLGTIVLHGRVLVDAGTPVRLVVTERRRAGNGASGELFLRVDPLQLEGGIWLPLQLLHPVLSPLLVAHDTQDITLPRAAKMPEPNDDVILPSGTRLRARTAATIDASNPDHTILRTPAPFIYSTDEPYSPFTPIPLATLGPRPSTPPRGRQRGRRGKPTPRPSPTESPTSTPTPTAAPTAS